MVRMSTSGETCSKARAGGPLTTIWSMLCGRSLDPIYRLVHHVIDQGGRGFFDSGPCGHRSVEPRIGRFGTWKAWTTSRSAWCAAASRIAQPSAAGEAATR